MDTPSGVERQEPKFQRKTNRSFRMALTLRLATALGIVTSSVAGGFDSAKNFITGGSVPMTEASSLCPPLPTDGRPAPWCVVPEDKSLTAQSEYFGYYFIDTNNSGRYDVEDKDVQGVPRRRILVETLEPIGSWDYTDIDFNSRTIKQETVIENGVSRVKDVIYYFDRKHDGGKGMWRKVNSSRILRVADDGGDGVARTPDNKSVVETNLNSGAVADKIWGPVDDQSKKEGKNCSGNCDWNCVDHRIVSRLDARAIVVDGQTVTNDMLHRGANNIVSSLADYVYYWDRITQAVHVDGVGLLTKVTPGDGVWKRENNGKGLTFKFVRRPEFIKSLGLNN